MIDLLNDRRIVVWYDAEGDFKEFAAVFNAPNCEVLSAGESILRPRRRADEVYRPMNESDNPAESGRCLLIYVPGHRGVTEDEKMQDPFEVYALAGAAFGDTEDQKIESLAGRGDKRLLKTVGGVGVVAEQSVGGLPDGRAVLLCNYLPVNHLRAALLIATVSPSI